MDDGGVWQEEIEAGEKIILDYFSTIFCSDQPTNSEASMEAMDKRVTPEMNNVLLKEFTVEEVKVALKQMHPIKSPGLDGMSPIFYQKYWETIGLGVLNCVLQALNTSIMPRGINHTYICLIPKTKNPRR